MPCDAARFGSVDTRPVLYVDGLVVSVRTFIVPDEVRELVEQKMREYEQRWVDEPIPALGGLTPRQALDDPARREDLLALLRELRDGTPLDALGMSAEGIEALLGIERR